MNVVIVGCITRDDELTKFYPFRINIAVTREPAKVLKGMQSNKFQYRIHVARSIKEAAEQAGETFRKYDLT